jgi:hypothetical protein
MSILISVIVQNFAYIKDNGDLGKWDIYGASQALSEGLPLFPKKTFQEPKSGFIGKSYIDGYSWNVLTYDANTMQYLSIKQYPTIILTNGKKEIGRIEGTPRTQGEVNEILKKMVGSKKSSLGLLAFALIGLAVPKDSLKKWFK